MQNKDGTFGVSTGAWFDNQGYELIKLNYKILGKPLELQDLIRSIYILKKNAIKNETIEEPEEYEFIMGIFSTLHYLNLDFKKPISAQSDEVLSKTYNLIT